MIDVAGIAPVDAYEIPDQMREAIHLITPADTFPYASCTSRTMDLDHTIPYCPWSPSRPADHPAKPGSGNSDP